MLAIMKSGSSQYVSPVLAITKEKNFFDKKIVVFDSNFYCIYSMPLYNQIKDKHSSAATLIRLATIIDYDDNGFEGKKWFGLPKLVNCVDLIKQLTNGGRISSTLLDGLSIDTKKPNIPDWFVIIDNKNVDNLMNVSFGFHDATLEEANDNENYLELKFSIWEGNLFIRFEYIIENTLYGKLGELLETELIKEDDCYIWKINKGFGGWVDRVDFDISSKDAYIKCHKISWKIEVEFQDDKDDL